MNSCNTIKVYIADVSVLNDPMRYKEALQLVDEKRRSRIERFRYKQGKLLSLGAGLLLEKALKEEGIRDTRIELAPDGKPYLKNHRDIFFSLSHSGTAVLCAISDAPVGCDIQIIKNVPQGVARRAFSLEEQNAMMVTDAQIQRQYFYKLWTGKESYLKMTGEGLKHMPNDFTISLPFGCQTVRGREVTFMDIPCEATYQAAVCVKGCISREQLEIKYIEL